MTDQRLAVVTAGAGGIGLEIARRLRDDGFRVVVTDINDDVAAEREAEGIGFRHLDSGNEAEMREVFASLGTVHTLVNNVGIRGLAGPIQTIPIDDFRKTIEVNTISHILASQLVIPGMIEAKAGSIIIISSMAARGGSAGRAPYGISKWALLGLARNLAAELGQYNIRANAILPGIMAGQRLQGTMQIIADQQGTTKEALFEEMFTHTHIARFIEPQEIAAAASFLASDLGSAVTASFLEVSGGLNMS